MNEKNWREKVFLFCIFGLITDIIITFIAMGFYAGGTRLNPSAPGYTFLGNTFSDLGRTKAWSGKDNTVSMIIFMIALSVGVISLILWAIAFPYFFTEAKLEKYLSIIGSIFVILLGIVYIGIRLAPSDISPDLHASLAGLTGGIYLIGGVLYIIVIFHNKAYPNRYAFAWILSLVITWIYIFIVILYVILFAVTITPTVELMFMVLGQKVINYTVILIEVYILYGAWKQIKS